MCAAGLGRRSVAPGAAGQRCGCIEAQGNCSLTLSIDAEHPTILVMPRRQSLEGCSEPSVCPSAGHSLGGWPDRTDRLAHRVASCTTAANNADAFISRAVFSGPGPAQGACSMFDGTR
jgi:hypothetical protein